MLVHCRGRPVEATRTSQRQRLLATSDVFDKVSANYLEIARWRTMLGLAIVEVAKRGFGGACASQNAAAGPHPNTASPVSCPHLTRRPSRGPLLSCQQQRSPPSRPPFVSSPRGLCAVALSFATPFPCSSLPQRPSPLPDCACLAPCLPRPLTFFVCGHTTLRIVARDSAVPEDTRKYRRTLSSLL
jgi:hypothetical protein